jgi:prepilin-type N-terminal cleavage/methylation domain-containing protein
MNYLKTCLPVGKVQKLKIKNSQKKGFTLIEVLIAMAIFSMMMVATATFFGSSISGYKNAKAIQKDVENAQFAMNLMAKTLRTSSILSCGGGACSTTGGPYTSVQVYDYSQAKCIEYTYDSVNKKITTRSSSTPVNVDTPALGCTVASWTGSQDMATSHVERANFYIIKSAKAPATPVVGRITTSIEICATSTCTGLEKDKVRIQSTSSLRDFKEAGM